MRKIYSLLFLFLLSYMAEDVLAQVIPVKFSDDLNTYAYNVNFRRRPTLYWTVDHAFSGEITQQALLPEGEDAIQRWKFVLVDEEYEPGVFYIINEESGEYAAFTEGGITDSYGKPVPASVETPNSAGYYYTDKGITPGKFKFLYVESQGGWSIEDAAKGPYLNDQSGRSVCHYSSTDNGCIIDFTLTGIPSITTNPLTLSLGVPIGQKIEGSISVLGKSLTSDIEVTIEGDDASIFSVTPPANFRGGLLPIVFAPTEAKTHSATLILKSEGVDDVEVALTGIVYTEADYPKFSSEDDSNENWYYIQFLRVLNDNITWSVNTSTREVMQTELTVTPDDKQMWKICGSWETGFAFVNKATGGELLYNVNENKEIIVPGTSQANGDTYVVTTPGSYGNLFDFVRYGSYWQLYNRDINGAPVDSDRDPLGFDYRYVYDRDGVYMRQTPSGYTNRNQLVFTPVKPLIKVDVATMYLMTAAAGETSELTINVTGIGMEGDIDVDFTGDAVFSISANSLPAEGGELTVTFAPVSDSGFYKTSLKLSSQGADDMIINITGSNGGPILGTVDSDTWHYIQFKRRANDKKVWQGNGIGSQISQVVLEEGNPNQQWKFTGTTDALFIENRAGGLFAFPKNEAGAISGDPNAVLFDENGDAVGIVYNESRNEWEFKYLLTGNGLNDRAGNYVCLYSLGDAGGPLIFFPVESEKVDRKEIWTNAFAISLAVPVGETATATVSVTGVNTTEAITATLTGDNAADFSLSATSLPAAGGDITITFAPTSADNFKATLTLSSAGVKDVVMSIVGTSEGFPVFSTPEKTVWHYIQFERQATKVWQGNGIGAEISQVAMEEDKKSQHWKFVGVWNEGFIVENREGGQIIFTERDEDGDVDGLATLAADGDIMVLTGENFGSAGKWELQLLEYYLNEDANWWGAMNDYYGNSICIYEGGDGGNPIKFIQVDTETGIKTPVIDPDDQLIATKYYTLQGIEVRKPATTGIYIVKQIYASGTTKASKMIVQIR